MDEFLSRFWNLEQVRVWAETCDPEVVRFAALAKDVAAQRQSECIAIRAKFAATNAAKAGRDIDAELWTASGETPTVRSWMPPRIIERELERRGIPAHELMFEEGLHVQKPKRLAVAGDALQPETSGPPYVFIRGAFPTIQYLEGLFRSGELVAIGNIHDDPIVREISVRDWSSLEIACGGIHEDFLSGKGGKYETKDVVTLKTSPWSAKTC